MFGLTFFDRTLRTLRERFGYDPGAFQKPILKGICEQAKASRATEIDAAVMFMLVQMNALEGRTTEITNFVRLHSNNVRVLMPFCTDPSGVLQLLHEISTKHGLIDKENSDDKSKHDYEGHSYFDYEDWYDAFKAACAMADERFELNEHGECIIDFLEDEPLRRACRDNVSPDELAKDFVEQFDVRSLER
jgi:hypothetical protein